LDQSRLRGPSRLRVDAQSIDLGNEPPLSVDGGTAGIIDRRRVSAQWFSGTILTGLCGAALMGGAVFGALDGETNFAAVPEYVQSALRAGADRIATTRKSDRLPPAGEANAARQVIKISTPTRGSGDREIMRVVPHIRVTANLALSTSELSGSIPPFNAQRLLAEAGADGTPVGDTAVEPDGEITFVTRDLTPLLPRARIATVLPMDDVIVRVREVANWAGPTPAARYMVAGVTPAGMRMNYAAEPAERDPYAGFEARIVPENITLMAKTGAHVTGGNSWSERAHTVKKGESISSILRDFGIGPDDIKAVATALGPRGRDGGLKEGQKLRILIAVLGQRAQPYRIIVSTEATAEAAVALSDLGKYVAVDVQSLNTEIAETSDDEEDDGTGVRLYHSIYETALRHQVPRPVIESLIRIYSYDVDFQRKARPGDAFDVLYTGEEETPGADGKTEVLFASLTIDGEVKKFYRYQTPDDNVVDFYDETGKSAKKFLVRKPLGEGTMRSGFGLRKHPILGSVRQHTGVDWAAPLGTPIYASGNGTVEKVGWESGYGKYVKLRHSNGYETAYGHMTAFAKGIVAGGRVRQGQVIGFVGSTGLSTGPHLHYEILVNGRFVDPMRIRLPRGRALDGPMLTTFEKERDRLDGLSTRRTTQASAAPTAAAR
jgi:murein DD-endopeptidase MepM/ murein hydrolase activator NlpD